MASQGYLEGDHIMFNNEAIMPQGEEIIMLLGKMLQESERMLYPENSEKQDVVKKFIAQSRTEVMEAVDQLSSMFITNSQVLGIEESV